MLKCTFDFTLRMSFFLSSWLVVIWLYITLFADTTYFMLWWTHNDIPTDIMNFGINLLRPHNITRNSLKHTTDDILQTLLKVIHCKDIWFVVFGLFVYVTVSVFYTLGFVVLFCGLQEWCRSCYGPIKCNQSAMSYSLKNIIQNMQMMKSDIVHTLLQS